MHFLNLRVALNLLRVHFQQRCSPNLRFAFPALALVSFEQLAQRRGIPFHCHHSYGYREQSLNK